MAYHDKMGKKFTFESDFAWDVYVKEMHFPVGLDELSLRVPHGQRVVQFVPVSLGDRPTDEERLSRLGNFPQRPAGVAIRNRLSVF